MGNTQTQLVFWRKRWEGDGKAMGSRGVGFERNFVVVIDKKNSHKRAVLFHILNYGSPTRGLLAEDIESAQAGVAA